jgi:4'-phosphopantetheinyl transferase EntD
VNKEEMKMVNDIESRTFNGETRNHKQESTIINHNAKQSINQIINHLTLIWCAKETMFKWYGLGNVDFKTMLEVNFETIETEGTFDAVIRINNDEKHININYRFFGKICLTFTHTI